MLGAKRLVVGWLIEQLVMRAAYWRDVIYVCGFYQLVALKAFNTQWILREVMEAVALPAVIISTLGCRGSILTRLVCGTGTRIHAAGVRALASNGNWQV